jgi:hypothetical protein
MEFVSYTSLYNVQCLQILVESTLWKQKPWNSVPDTSLQCPVSPNASLQCPVSPDASLQCPVSPDANLQCPVSPDASLQCPVSPDASLQCPVSPDASLQCPVSPDADRACSVETSGDLTVCRVSKSRGVLYLTMSCVSRYRSSLLYAGNSTLSLPFAMSPEAVKLCTGH